MEILLSTPTISVKATVPVLRRGGAALCIGSFTGVGVFILPFFFPPAYLAQSGSYTAGFNNRVAVLAAASASVLAFVWAWCFAGRTYALPTKCDKRIPLAVVGVCLTVSAAFTGYCGWMLTKSGIAYIDNLYFIEAMHSVVDFHLRIYRDFSFLYGPALLEWPVAVALLLRHLHVSIQGSYFVALALFQVAGLALLWATLEWLPLSRPVRIAMLCLFTAGVLCPTLGMNYNLVRSLLPFSTLLFLSRIRGPAWWIALAFAGGEVLQLLFSPELGVAFAGGAVVFALLMARRQDRRWILAAFAPLAGFAVFTGIAGEQYFDSIRAFSKGSLNLVIEPLPYILFYLVSAVWLVPLLVAGLMRQRSDRAILMASLFVTSLGMLPVALGRCDPLHVFFNGAGMLLLAGIAVSHYGKVTRGCWWTLFILMILSMQFAITAMNFGSLSKAAQIAAAPNGARQTIDLSRLSELVGGERIAVPFTIPYSIEQQLIDTRHYAPDRDCFFIRIWDPDAETAKALRMNQSRWALIPNKDQRGTEGSKISALIVGSPFLYRDRKKPYVAGALIYANLSQHWTPVSSFGDLTLYERTDQHQELPISRARARNARAAVQGFFAQTSYP